MAVDRVAFLGTFREEFVRFLKLELSTERWNAHEEEDVDYTGRLLSYSFAR